MAYQILQTMPKGGKAGLGSLLSDIRKFKRRLRVVLQNTATTQSEIVEILQGRHVNASQSGVSRWMDEEDHSLPDIPQLMALMASHHDLSVDWLIGRKKPESPGEIYIESKI